MLTRRRFLALTGFTGIAAGGAVLGYRALPSGGDGPASGPPTIAYGKDSCAHCGMVIADVRFAAAWRQPNGKVQRFDDIGCMVSFAQEESPAAGTLYWVHDYTDEFPIGTAEATFVVAESLVTPMAYGIVAVSSPERATELLRQHPGESRSWAQLSTTQHGGH